MNATDKSKAEKAFRKALAKDPLSAPAMFGLGQVAFAKGDVATAIKRTEEGLTLSPKSYEEHFNLMRWYCMKGDSTSALDHMRAVYWDSAYRHRIWQSDTTKAMDLIRSKAAFRRWHSGILRIKVQPLDAFSNETDKGTENDQFVTVVSEGREILATTTIQNKNQAYWKRDYVIFDTYIDSAITITQLDEDYLFCDVLSSRAVDPRMTGEVMVWATNSHLRVMITDTDEPVYTTGTSLPTTPSLSTTLSSIKAVRVLSNPDELDKTNRLK
jgi:tetratricopeptide (TPR) repeat protein